MSRTRVLLSAYSIRVRRKRTKEYEKLDLFDDAHDFLSLCNSFLVAQKEIQSHEVEQQSLMVLQKVTKVGRAIHGMFRSGEYGQACDVVSAQDGNTVYSKTVHDADMLPSYFRIEVPSDKDEGFLIVERRGGTGGIKTALTKKINAWFEEKHSEFTIDWNPLMPADVLENIAKKATIQNVRFIHYGLPKDIADRLSSGHKERWGTMEVVLKARRNSSLPLRKELTRFLSLRKTAILENSTNCTG